MNTLFNDRTANLGILATAGLAISVLFAISSLHAQDNKATGGESANGQRWALLIGVNDYAQFKKLRYCEYDVEALRDTLVGAGFPKDNVFMVSSAAKGVQNQPIRATIQRQLKVVLGMAEEGDMVVVSFSGHGIHISGRTYLCPSEANEEDPAGTMIPLTFVFDELSRCGASQKMLWIDACRNDPRRVGSREAHAKSLSGISRSLVSPPEGILVLASCKEGEKSWEHDEFKHGVFVHYLLEGLSGKADRQSGDRNNRVSLLELYKYANVNTKRLVAKQWMESQTPELFGRITGDFDIAESLPQPLPSEITNSIGMKLKLIPAGEFMMGSSESAESLAKAFNLNVECSQDEHPQHRVRITEPFYLGAHEVTQGQWERVMGSRLRDIKDEDWEFYGDGANYPMYYVSWYDAVAFCNKLSELEGKSPYYRMTNIKRETFGTKPGIDGADISVVGGSGYRLPTEAEWEYACRAGTTTPFHFGRMLNGTQANCDGDYPYGTGMKGPDLDGTTTVGSYAASAWGLYDMHGNVSEWCQDWYGADYYEQSSTTGPTGPTSGSYRVNRGGGWGSTARICRSAFRFFNSPGIRASGFGFRVAQVPSE